MKYADNVLEVAKLLPDFLGFIFYPMSKRFVGNNFVMPEIPPAIKKTGVFVNDRIENIFEKISRYQLDLIQLHGDEPAAICKKIMRRTKVIKAFGIDEKFNFSLLKEYENACDYFLFDTKIEKYGGSGKSFDKNLLKHYTLSKPFFLSGGLDSMEILNLISRAGSLESPISNMIAIDVNSKFETEPGLKDIAKLTNLLNAIHSR